jgi:hypothetical protein
VDSFLPVYSLSKMGNLKLLSATSLEGRRACTQLCWCSQHAGQLMNSYQRHQTAAIVSFHFFHFSSIYSSSLFIIIPSSQRTDPSLSFFLKYNYSQTVHRSLLFVWFSSGITRNLLCGASLKQQIRALHGLSALGFEILTTVRHTKKKIPFQLSHQSFIEGQCVTRFLNPTLSGLEIKVHSWCKHNSEPNLRIISNRFYHNCGLLSVVT